MCFLPQIQRFFESISYTSDKRIKTLLDPVDCFYHVSPKKGLTSLKPQNGKNRNFNDTAFGHSVVSMADTIRGCVQALYPPQQEEYLDNSNTDSINAGWAGLWKSVKKGTNQYEMSVYRISKDVLSSDKTEAYETDDPSSMVIHDQILTGELAYSSEVPCEELGILTIKTTHDEQTRKKLNKPYIVLTLNTLSSQSKFDPKLAHCNYGNVEPVGYFDLSLDPKQEDIDLDEDFKRFERRLRIAQDYSKRILQKNIKFMNMIY